MDQAGIYADRLSVNIELPREPAGPGFTLAPAKSHVSIEQFDGPGAEASSRFQRQDHGTMARESRFLHRQGQSTQMIVGRDSAYRRHANPLAKASNLYGETAASAEGLLFGV